MRTILITSLCDYYYVDSSGGNKACKVLGKHSPKTRDAIADGKYRGDGFYKRHFKAFTGKGDGEIFPEYVNIFDAVSRRIKIRQIKGKLLKPKFKF